MFKQLARSCQSHKIKKRPGSKGKAGPGTSQNTACGFIEHLEASALLEDK
jgi:hypothetical protein